MTPKEKAKELYFKMHSQEHIISKEAKQCALIAADEVMQKTLWDKSEQRYWMEVKKEIEAL